MTLIKKMELPLHDFSAVSWQLQQFSSTSYAILFYYSRNPIDTG
jgi:hypothetical protein